MAVALGLPEHGDHPKWRMKCLTDEERPEIRWLRYRRDKGEILTIQRDYAIKRIKDVSRRAYEAQHPRRPKRWKRAVNEYIKRRDAIIALGGLTKEGAMAIVARVSDDDVRKRRFVKQARSSG